MKEWKELKDKEVIIGLIIIIVLGIIALSLLIRREIQHRKEEPVATEEKESKKNKSDVGLYDILGSEEYVYYSLTERKQEDGQLKELFEYWDAYKLDAVAELVRLERLQKVSEELEGTRNFYYFGAVDRLGRPSGKGLAVYPDNTYYCGEWKEGLRHGKGMWLEVAIYTEENRNYNLGVIEHSYNGQWSKDLPNGEGQEHFSYDYNVMQKGNMKTDKCTANVIGEFKDGYYNGEMYIMTVDSAGITTDWSGTCNEGSWIPIEVGSSTDSVWESYEKDSDGNPMFHYLFPKDNKDYGIMGLKK